MSQKQQDRPKPIDVLEQMLELAQDGDFIASLRRQRKRQVALAVCHRDGRENASHGVPRERTRDRVVRARVRAGGRTKRMEARELAAMMYGGAETFEDDGPAADLLEELITSFNDEEPVIDEVHELALIECGCVGPTGCSSIFEAFAFLCPTDPTLEMDEAGWTSEGSLNVHAAFAGNGFCGFHVVEDLRTWEALDD
ncbi:MAG: hypothetical protein AAB459_01080 [Patescibacteria group bacterium]